MGAWTVGRGGYRYDDRVAVIVLFTLPTQISEDVVGDLLFTHLYKDAEYDAPRMDEEGLCWLFLHLYDLLTDWQNIIRECERRLDESVRHPSLSSDDHLHRPRRLTAAGVTFPSSCARAQCTKKSTASTN